MEKPKYPERWQSFMPPVYVSDLVGKQNLTYREQYILKTKLDIAEQYGVDPNMIFVHEYGESF